MEATKIKHTGCFQRLKSAVRDWEVLLEWFGGGLGIGGRHCLAVILALTSYMVMPWRQGLVFIFVGKSEKTAGAPLAFACQKFVWRADGGSRGYEPCLLFAGTVSDECGVKGGECWGTVSAQVEWIWSKLSANSWAHELLQLFLDTYPPMFWCCFKKMSNHVDMALLSCMKTILQMINLLILSHCIAATFISGGGTCHLLSSTHLWQSNREKDLNCCFWCQ